MEAPARGDARYAFYYSAILAAIFSLASGKAAEDATVPPVIIAENFATVSFPSSIWPFSPSKRWVQTTFAVRSVSQPKKSIWITSSGLGDTTFVVDGVAGASPQRFLQTEVDETGKHIRAALPMDLLPRGSTSAEGKIVVLTANAKPVEAALKIEHPLPLLLTSFQWFWAILIPGAVGAILAYAGTRLTSSWSARNAAITAFTQFKDDHHQVLSDFFTAFYRAASEKSDSEFIQVMNMELRAKKILPAVARRERKKLEKALLRANSKRVKDCLGKLFPEWRQYLEEKVGQEGNV